MSHMPKAGGAAKINAAAASEPKSGHKPPARASGVGNERKADVRAAQQGQPTDHNPLRGAVQHIASEHPHSYDDHGPHHGTTSHVRHEPLHGMKVRGK